VAEFVANVESEWKQIDLLVNNAGLGIMAPVHELEIRHWDRMMNANLRGTFLFTRAVVPGMIGRQEGTIINIASIAGKDGFVGGTGYAASKHAIMGFTDSLWREVREHNIQVCAICPGSVDTHFFGPDVGKTGREHMMRPDDVAEAVLYVARQPDRLFIKEIEMRVTHPRKG
jgi:3-oxoacyl-[acyl-carrier protein] reductase